MRIWDATKIAPAINFFLQSDDKVDPIEWLSNPVNICLENDQGDLALLEYSFPNKSIYSCHYFYKSRGRAAINATKDFLDELYNTCYNINILMGLVPIERKDVRWMTRRVGFTSYGIEEIHGKQYELFIQTKEEFNGKHL